MAGEIEIPKLVGDKDEYWDHTIPGPGWFSNVDSKGNKLKPLIKCKCGKVSGIKLHHVHTNGIVTRSYWCATAAELAAMGEAGKRFSPGCGWHVWLKLLDYDDGDFPPEK